VINNGYLNIHKNKFSNLGECACFIESELSLFWLIKFDYNCIIHRIHISVSMAAQTIRITWAGLWADLPAVRLD